MYGLLFTIIGAIVAILGNFILLPKIGILGSAISIVLSYLVMTIACYLFGKKYFPVPYKFIPMVAYSIFFLAVVIASFYIHFNNRVIDIAFNLSIPVAMLAVVYWIERKNILKTVDN